MSTDFQDLKRRMTKLPADELLDIVTINARDYKPEALHLAREELEKRGYSELDLQNLRASTSARTRSSDSRSPLLKFALTLIVTAVLTFSIFAPLIYYSIVVYGIPCAIFISAGYLIWRVLRRRDPQQARAFAIGFTFSVSVLMTAISTAVPWYIGLIVVECVCLWILMKLSD